MNGLYGIWCKLCALFNVIANICVMVDNAVANNTTICNLIDQIVGDPNADCPDCDPDPLATPLVEKAKASTVVAKETTAKVIASAVALKAQFAETTKTATKGEA